MRRKRLADSSSGSAKSSSIAIFSGPTSPRSTNPGSRPSELPMNVVPERGAPTTKTGRSLAPVASDAAFLRPRRATRAAAPP